jgi:CheY-like chemotaxis protein
MIRHILLIDDNEIDNYITKQLLTKHRVAESITTKQSAMDALEYLNSLMVQSQSFPEVIFLDISMPEMDGFGFLNVYDSYPELIKTGCSIIMLSSSQNPDDINKAKNNPYVRKYIQKPLTNAVLMEVFDMNRIES